MAGEKRRNLHRLKLNLPFSSPQSDSCSHPVIVQNSSRSARKAVAELRIGLKRTVSIPGLPTPGQYLLQALQARGKAADN